MLGKRQGADARKVRPSGRQKAKSQAAAGVGRCGFGSAAGYSSSRFFLTQLMAAATVGKPMVEVSPIRAW